MKFTLLVATAAAAQTELAKKECDTTVYTSEVTSSFTAVTDDAAKCLESCATGVTAQTDKGVANDYCCVYDTAKTCKLHSVAKRATWATATKAKDTSTSWEWKAGVKVEDAEATSARALATGLFAVAATAMTF